MSIKNIILCWVGAVALVVLVIGNLWLGYNKHQEELAAAAKPNITQEEMQEATSGLDSFAESKLLKKLLDASNGKTVILISHRLSNITNVDKIYFLNNGKISESGSHRELMRAGGEYAEMFNLQASEYLAHDRCEDTMKSHLV